MSTRGAFGFKIDGKYKMGYNHGDSYPSGLGQDIINFLRPIVNHVDTVANLRERARALKIVGDKKPPTQGQINALKQYSDLHVSHGTYDDWYCLLRLTQGDMQKALDAGYVYGAGDFKKGDMGIEWAYVVDLDKDVLEVYRGDAGKKPVATYPFADLPESLDEEALRDS